MASQERSGRDTEARDGDAHVAMLDGGWQLTVTLHKGVVSGATAELRNDREHYAIMQQSTALFDLSSNGFEPHISVDSSDRPTVIWRKGDESPFVWFCALDVADWSHPL